MAQSVERHLGKVEVTGSIPVISFRKPLNFKGFLLSREDLVTLTCESSFLKSKNASRGCALARRSSMSQATALGARMCCAHSLFLYRKVLKKSDMMYNKQEIKNGITKERRGLRQDVDYEVFCFVGWTALSDYRERIIMSMELSIPHNLSISFK